MKRTRILAAAAVVLAALTLASCQDFFTSSLAGWAQRDPTVPSGLTADQAMTIANQAVANRDTGLAQALLPQMAAFVGGSPSAALVASAVDTAVLASGIDEAFGNALTTLGTDIIEGGGSLTPAQIDALTALLDSIVITADSISVFTYLEGQPAADMAAAGVTAADYVMAAAALLISDIGDAAALSTLIQNDFSTYVPGPNDALISALISDASAQWPDDPLLDALTTMFDAL